MNHQHTAALHLLDIAHRVGKLQGAMPREEPQYDVCQAVRRLCEERADALVAGESCDVADDARRLLSWRTEPDAPIAEEEREALVAKFHDALSTWRSPRPAPPMPVYPRRFSWSRYAELSGCYRPEELKNFSDEIQTPSLEGRTAAEIRSLEDTPHEHFIVSMLTEPECDVVAGPLLREILHLLPDRVPGWSGDTPRAEHDVVQFASHAWASWRESAARNRRRQLAIGKPEDQCVTAPMSRQTALEYLSTNVRRTLVRAVDGFGSPDDSRCTDAGYAEWRRIDHLFRDTLIATLSGPVSPDIKGEPA